jgi:hypothetical protein
VAGPELALAKPQPTAAMTIAQLGPEVRPERRGLQIAVDEHVVEPIEPARLDRQRRGSHALLDERDTLLAERAQNRPSAAEYTRNGQLDAIEVAPQPQVRRSYAFDDAEDLAPFWGGKNAISTRSVVMKPWRCTATSSSRSRVVRTIGDLVDNSVDVGNRRT